MLVKPRDTTGKCARAPARFGLKQVCVEQATTNQSYHDLLTSFQEEDDSAAASFSFTAGASEEDVGFVQSLYSEIVADGRTAVPSGGEDGEPVPHAEGDFAATPTSRALLESRREIQIVLHAAGVSLELCTGSGSERALLHAEMSSAVVLATVRTFDRTLSCTAQEFVVVDETLFEDVVQGSGGYRPCRGSTPLCVARGSYKDSVRGGNDDAGRSLGAGVDAGKRRSRLESRVSVALRELAAVEASDAAHTRAQLDALWSACRTGEYCSDTFSAC